MSDFRSHAQFSIANSSRHIQMGSSRRCCLAVERLLFKDMVIAGTAIADRGDSRASASLWHS
jgi:hypothetical protein